MGTAPHAQDALTPIGQGLWTSMDPVRIVGMRLTAAMTVVELPRSRLLVYSPVELTPGRRAAIDALGTVAHLYAPNTYHHLWMGAWADAYPGAVVHAPHGLRAKRPDLRIDRDHDREAPGDLADDCDEVHVAGFWLEETVLVHRASRTLLVADLVHNIGRPKGLWAKVYTSAMGFYDRIAVSRAIRWGAFPDRAAARTSVDAIARCDFDRIVPGHGSPVESGGPAALLGAYAWLKPRARRPALVLPERGRGFCG